MSAILGPRSDDVHAGKSHLHGPDRRRPALCGVVFGLFGLVLGPCEAQIKGGTAFDRLELSQLAIGSVGSASGADRTQKFVHSLIDAENPAAGVTSFGTSRVSSLNMNRNAAQCLGTAARQRSSKRST